MTDKTVQEEDDIDNFMRVFFVVDGDEKNCELFETYEQAEDFQLTLPKEDNPKISVALVRNAFKEEGEWNYDDLADTFNFIHEF